MRHLITSLVVMGCSSLFAQTSSPLEIELQLFTTNTNGPVDIANAGDARLFVVEQNTADIEIYDLTGAHLGQFIDLSGVVNTSGNERGLLGMAFHPDYSNNGKFYVNYTAGSSPGDTHIAEYTVTSDPNVADPASEVIILDIDQDFSNHNGGCIQFGPDGYLYIGMGDGGSGGDPNDRSQNPQSYLGKMLRINVSGNGTYTVPADNPFVDDASTLDEIWALGVRNPWKFSFDRITGDMWIADVGQGSWEEVDFQSGASTGGENWGWRCYEGNATYNTSGCSSMSDYDFPIAQHSHGGGENWCSITGGYVYRGVEFESMLGKYFYTDYCAGGIKSIEADGLGDWIYEDPNTQGTFGYTTFGEDNLGEMYIAHHGNNTIYKLVDPCDDFNPQINLVGSELQCDIGDNFWWYLEGNIIAGANSANYTPTTDGVYYCVSEDADGCAKETNAMNIVACFYGVLGCNDTTADNYDSLATVDDGSCTYPVVPDCAADFDGNLIIDTGDLLEFLTYFGMLCD
jgi:hypothetical protein